MVSSSTLVADIQLPQPDSTEVHNLAHVPHEPVVQLVRIDRHATYTVNPIPIHTELTPSPCTHALSHHNL